jgi:hypothetical protein
MVARRTTGGRWRAAAAGAALALSVIALPSTAEEPSRQLQSVWVIQPTPVPAGERLLSGGEFVLRQRLLPSGLAELDGPLSLGDELLPAGAQLVEARTSGAKVYCVPGLSEQRKVGARYRPCLIDADGDGAFEGWFDAVSGTQSILMHSGRYPKKPRAIAATRYHAVSPRTMREVYFVGIERRNYFNIYSRESFMIAFGNADKLERLTTPVSFKSEEMPRELTVLGSRFTALSEQDGKLLIRISQTMPLQAFGVATSTRVQFY